METINKCLVCGGNNISNHLTCKDYVATGEEFELQKCSDCTFLFTNPRPKESEIYKYYQSDKYISHSGKKEGFGLMYKVYDIVRNYSIKQKLNLIKSYHKDGRLLDLGCGLGYFLNGAIQDKTFSCEGMDVSEDAISYVRKTFGYTVKNESELNDYLKGTFDIITQWHVLEHVHKLNERMIQLSYLIKPNGTMFIAVPNSDSWDANKYQAFWDGYDVPRHLYHFNQKSFNTLMNNHGFEVIETKPLLFDAPYISMRSEVHKGSKLTMLKGAINGLISNSKAKSKNDYSSLLFIVKKIKR